ncbi:MAG: M13 family metallopeptidase N-terminal domain-containing protein, partial [Ginsengibacter sp.]
MNVTFRSALVVPFLFFINTAIFSQKGSKKSLLLKTNYIDRKNMDLTMKPGDNFFLYANGNWKKNNPVPASRTRWGSFDELREENSKRLSTLLDEASKNTSRNRNTRIIGDFYYSGMDSVSTEKKSYEPIKMILGEIDNINSVSGVLHAIAVMRINGYGSAAFGVFVGPDRKNVLMNIPSIGQGGISLPDRDYYLKDDARSVKIREAYMQNLKTMLALIGEDANEVNINADAVIKIETRLAGAQMPRVELRDPYKTYNKFSVKDLSAITPNID